ncbi:hypothetical protein ACFT2C_14530 [Promicromonospora sp. NPDC057138]|uniref:hypothetical protein n=1 Tax=Promicromonospora sp. NPDC057138 TaxID=3346031 RepID=UPI003639A3A8
MVEVDPALATALPAFELAAPAGYELSSSAQVYVAAWPTEVNDESFPDGGKADLHTVDATMTNISASGATINIAPETIPAAAVYEGGLVDFEVDVVDTAAGWEGSTSLTARATDLGAGAVWADPLYAVEDLEAEGAGVTADGGVPVATAELTVTAEGSAAAKDMAPADCNVFYSTTLLGHRNVWSRVGSTFVNSDWVSEAAFGFASGVEHTWEFGIGSSTDNSSFSASGTKTVKSDWGFNFVKNNSFRAYKVQVDFGRYEIRRTFDCVSGTDYFYKFRARYTTGGVESASLSSKPDYRNCAPLNATGEWHRESSSGNAYKASGGIEAASAIGINLDAERQYSVSKKYTYWPNSTNKKICGGDLAPAYASNVALFLQ